MILIVDKPAGMTSARVVNTLKRCLPRGTRIGHTGTLDPMCTGVLPVLTDADTHLSDLFPKEKAYVAELRLGVRTDTQDVTGTVLQTHDVTVSRAQIEAVLPRFTGEIDQIPPMYSAIRVQGRHLYELARKGIETERAPRRVTVFSLRLGEQTGEHTYRLCVECSAGTYIRTLCDDIGAALGCGGTMASLCRTRSNGFTLDEARSLEEMVEAAQNGTLAAYSRRAEDVFASLDRVVIPADGRTYFVNGGAIAPTRVLGRTNAPMARAYATDGTFLALCEKTPDGWKSVWLNR